jgi:hypothetical protein
VELEIKPVQSKGLLGKIQQREPEQIDLILNIHFGKHREEVSGGSVTFGLKRGELKVELTNGEVPLKNIKLKDEFQTVVEIEVQEEKASEEQVGATVAVTPGLAATWRETGKTAEKVKYQAYQVSTKGELNDPIWVFEVKTNEEILQGLLQNTELATIDVKTKPCCLVATFYVMEPEDICLTDAQWFLTKQIPKKKMAVIERRIVRLFLEKKLKQKPYLSRVELAYG